jgi:hypothetical protein
MSDTTFAILVFLLTAPLAFALSYRNILAQFRFLTIPGALYFLYILLVAAPAYAVFFDQDGQPARKAFLLAAESALVTLAWGVRLAYKNQEEIGQSCQQISQQGRRPVMLGPQPERLRLFCNIGLAVAAMSVAAYLMVVETVPLFELLKDDQTSAHAYALLREDSFKLLPLPVYAYFETIRMIFLPMLSMVGLGMYLATRLRKWLIHFVFSAVLTFFFSALSLAKAPPLIFLVMCGTYWFLARGCRIPVWGFVLVLAAGAIFPIYVANATAGNSAPEVSDVFATMQDLLFRRFLYLNAELLYYHFDIFPAAHHFLWGQSIRLVSLISAQREFLLPNYVYLDVWGNLPEALDSGWANTVFLGGLWADFGWLGVLIGPVLIGYYLQKLQNFILKLGKNVVGVTCHVILLTAAAYISMNSATGLGFLGIVVCTYIFARIMRGPLQGEEQFRFAQLNAHLSRPSY